MKFFHLNSTSLQRRLYYLTSAIEALRSFQINIKEYAKSLNVTLWVIAPEQADKEVA
ncbi:hypothetical protein [Nostoc sp.]|uniref:hypothetical protein n=1 Tax=Nostoc sp. TaxID=1180 RepID=UPI003593D982